MWKQFAYYLCCHAFPFLETCDVDCDVAQYIKGSKHEKVCQKHSLKKFNFKNNIFSMLTLKYILKTIQIAFWYHGALHWVYCKFYI
jgi:hypothetical protein